MRALCLVLLLTLPAGSAFAQGHFVLPRIGLGGGVGGRTFTDPLLRLDFILGGEWRRPGGDAMGFDLRFAIAGAMGRPNNTGWSTLQAGLDFNLTTSFDDGMPFAGVAVGPLVVSNHDEATGQSFGGGGLHLEGTVGFKSYIELYGAASVTLDRAGFLPMLVGGLRVHTDFIWVLWIRPVRVESRPAPAVHDAAPVGHGAEPVHGTQPTHGAAPVDGSHGATPVVAPRPH